MRRALVLLLAVMMAVAFWPFAGLNASAATGDDQSATAPEHKGHIGSSFTPGKYAGSEDEGAKKGEVLVLLKDSDSADLSDEDAGKIESIDALAKGGKKSAKVELTKSISVSGDDIWVFGDENGRDDMTVALAKSDSLSTEKMVKKLKDEDMVDAVSPNYIRHAYDVNDPYFGYQWSMGEYPGAGVTSKWPEDTGNSGTGDEPIVAVIDTGVDYTHEDLKGLMWENPYGNALKGSCGFNFASGYSDPLDPKDDNGHGTHCAGIIGAAVNNGKGIAGVCPDVRIMALKVLDFLGSGEDADIISAFNYVYKAKELGENVVATNCSFGGEEYNEVEERVIGRLGEIGVLCVCAAGNDGMDIDGGGAYPACYDCDNIISVAATKKVGEKAELASYSNWGKEDVDIAAPGTDILSTVSYDCFNPTLYGTDEAITKIYLSGSEDDADTIRGLTYKNIDPSEITYDETVGLFGKGSIKIHFDPAAIDKTNYKWQYFAIPYELPADYDPKDQDVVSSIAVRFSDGPQIGFDAVIGKYDRAMLLDVPLYLIDLSEDNPYREEAEKFLKRTSLDIAADFGIDEVAVFGESDYWQHLQVGRSWNNITPGLEEYDPGKDRQRAVLVIGDPGEGEFTINVDDIGVSQCVSDWSVFGQYDIYSGTSMATPCVTGAAALIAGTGGDKSAETIKNELLATANDSNSLMVKTGGALDFGNDNGFWINISSASVDTAKEQVILNGAFNVGEGSLDVKIRKTGDGTPWEDVPKAAIVGERTDSKITVENNGWINNCVDILVTGTKDGKTKTASMSEVYLVKGKKQYDVLAEDVYVLSSDAALTTDGRKIYAADSTGDHICVMDPKNIADGDIEDEVIFTKDLVKKYFDVPAESTPGSPFDFRFGDDIVLIGNTVYVKGSFCEVKGDGFEDEEDEYGGDEYEDESETFPDSSKPAYSEETALFSVNMQSGEVKKIKNPEGAELPTDSKLASFNGSLFMLGGFNEKDKQLSKKVYKYNASKKTWTAAADMPAGRAGGKVLQSRGSLIYTLGYGAESEVKDQSSDPVVPANYVFDGNGWTEGNTGLKPVYREMYKQATVTRGGSKYLDIRGSVGLCRDGLVYMDTPVADYGDTFIYDVKNDKYKSTKWNYARNLYEVMNVYDYDSPFTGIAIGRDLFGFDSMGSILKVKNAVDSALLKVSAAGAKGGRITGTGDYLYGATCTVKAIAKPGYYAKSLSVSGAKAKTVSKGLSASFAVKKDAEAKATFAKLKVKVKSKITVKAGKSKKLKAKITPSAAAKQWKLAYKSSNTKYAKVTSKGVVKAKKAGKGKTVKIKIMLKGTKKVMKTVKVKIK